ncbi:MAG: 3-dehydroquinate synthase [Candidatus Poribacteria bacterium]|nr:MAG: 3-dehydroquinate synthase [Candidatus Poribacteria bacterium]
MSKGTITCRIPVRLGDRSYPIVIGQRTLLGLPEALDFVAPSSRIAVVTSPSLYRLYGEALVEALKEAGFQAWWAQTPDGEEHKTLESAARLYDQFVEHRMERRSLVIALGGGVIGDLAGFVAATYMRGVPFLQVPTTLIAQVDSSVGGKVAVDHPRGKNLIGAFYQPRLVWIDVATLLSLPEREYRAGIAEVLRYGVIASPELFQLLEERMEVVLRRDLNVLAQIVAKSCAIKARIVEEDETESGVRATLNYGHTFAHAIEAATGYQRFRHGEAVAIGMVCAAAMALQRGLVSQEFAERQRRILEAAGLPTACPEEVEPHALLEAMRLDKKVSAGKIRFIVPREVGRVEIRDDFTDSEVIAAIRATYR